MLMLRALFVSVTASSASVLRFIDNNTVILLTPHAAYPETKRGNYKDEAEVLSISIFSDLKSEKRRGGREVWAFYVGISIRMPATPSRSHRWKKITS